jgi:Skp family chaperone for outer membrane proteins
MKNYITLMSISLIVFACANDDKKKINSKPTIEARDLNGFKIAYYNNDSIKEYFDYYKREDSLVTRKQKIFQAEIDKRTSELQNYVQRKDQEARSGLLSQNEIGMAQQKAQQMESNIMQYQQTEGAKLEAETVKKLEDISNKIEVLGKKYCEIHKIDILLMHGKGGQLNYISKTMDVTKEFIQFLNENQDKIEKDLK